MQTFIGTKIINARAMTRGEYNAFRGWTVPADEDPSDAGYLVEYTDGGKPNHPAHAGYVSWSPKEQFDGAYIAVPPSTGSAPFAPHQMRVVAEKAQLDDRLTKLSAFISGSPIFAKLPDEERARLVCQEEVMTDYSLILGERIAAFTA